MGSKARVRKSHAWIGRQLQAGSVPGTFPTVRCHLMPETVLSRPHFAQEGDIQAWVRRRYPIDQEHSRRALGLPVEGAEEALAKQSWPDD